MVIILIDEWLVKETFLLLQFDFTIIFISWNGRGKGGIGETRTPLGMDSYFSPLVRIRTGSRIVLEIQG